MKTHIDNLSTEKEAFEKRKEDLKNKTEKEASEIKNKNRNLRRQEQRKAEKEAAKKQAGNQDASVTDNTKATTDTKSITDTKSTTDVPIISDNVDDQAAIKNLIEYLEDPELQNKYQVDKSTLNTISAAV